MDKFLKRYLWITGIGSLVVVSDPNIVLLGYLLLILPGLILELLPTAFFWGATFAILRKPFMKRFDRQRASMAAVGAAALLLVLAPIPARILAASQVDEHAIEDIIPSTPIAPFGDVRLDLALPHLTIDNSVRLKNKQRPYTCNALCVTFLFAPNVKSVTVDPSRDSAMSPRMDTTTELPRNARTYRLLPRSQCAGMAIAEPSLVFSGELWGSWEEARKYIKPAWQEKVAFDVCLVGEPPRPAYDFLFREVKENNPPNAKPSAWFFFPSPTQIRSLSIRNAEGEYLLHINRVSAKAPAIPLRAGLNGPIESGFTWKMSKFDGGKDALPTLEVLEAVRLYTTIAQSLPTVPE